VKQREFDVIVWGASGFTGALVVEYLISTYGVDGDLKWAIAGRNKAKLEQVRGKYLTDNQQASLTIFIADSQDEKSLAELVGKTRVLCTTVGPYALYGTPVVAACVAAGTHYCDLTGEVLWLAKTTAAYQQAAQASGARIVHTCGFDSIPFDPYLRFRFHPLRPGSLVCAKCHAGEARCGSKPCEGTRGAHERDRQRRNNRQYIDHDGDGEKGSFHPPYYE